MFGDTDLIAFVAVGGFYLALVLVIREIATTLTLRKIVDKGTTVDQIKELLRRRTDPGATRKWALVTLAVGVGFVLLQWLPPQLQQGPAAIGVILVLAAGGLWVGSRLEAAKQA